MNNIFNNVNMIANFKRAMKDPKSLAMNMAKNNNNPIVKQLIQYAENGQTDKIEEFARNVFKEKGMNFDEQYNSIMNLIK